METLGRMPICTEMEKVFKVGELMEVVASCGLFYGIVWKGKLLKDRTPNPIWK